MSKLARMRMMLTGEFRASVLITGHGDDDDSALLCLADGLEKHAARIRSFVPPPNRDSLVRVRERIARELADIDRQLDALGSPEDAVVPSAPATSWQDQQRERDCALGEAIAATYNRLTPAVSMPHALDAIFGLGGDMHVRKHSAERTEECPMEDPVNGGYCESDAQFRSRIKAGLAATATTTATYPYIRGVAQHVLGHDDFDVTCDGFDVAIKVHREWSPEGSVAASAIVADLHQQLPAGFAVSVNFEPRRGG